jgi:hypothetical protein
MYKDGIIKACGILITANLWKYYGSKILGQVSNKLDDFGKSLHIPHDCITWVEPEYLVGVTLISQLFPINNNQSPIMKFTQKSVIGFGYYAPTIATYEFTKFIVNKFESYINSDIAKPIALVTAVTLGGISGNFFQKHASHPMNVAGSYVDIIAQNTLIIAYSTFNLLIGKTNAEEVTTAPLDNHKNYMNDFLLGVDSKPSNVTSILDNECC